MENPSPSFADRGTCQDAPEEPLCAGGRDQLLPAAEDPAALAGS